MSSKSQYQAEIEIQAKEIEKQKRIINACKSKISQLDALNKNLESELSKFLKVDESKNKRKSWLNTILSSLQNLLYRN